MVEHIVSVNEDKWSKLLSNSMLWDNWLNSIIVVQPSMTNQSKATCKQLVGGRVQQHIKVCVCPKRVRKTRKLEREYLMDVVRICWEHGEKESNNSFYFHVLSYLENGLELRIQKQCPILFHHFWRKKRTFSKGRIGLQRSWSCCKFCW